MLHHAEARWSNNLDFGGQKHFFFGEQKMAKCKNTVPSSSLGKLEVSMLW